MSDRPKKSHGGARPGAGRKRKVRSATILEDADIAWLMDAGAPEQVETAARKHARQAIAVLAKKMLHGANESARVSACNEILDRGYGKPGVEVGGDQGLLPLISEPGDYRELVDEVRAEARRFCNVAIEVLRRIAEFGASESASVSAARALLNRGVGTVGVAKLPDDLTRQMGKREQVAEDARDAATGIFEPPKPPGSALQ